MKKLNGLILGAGNFANFSLQRFTTVQEAKYGKDLSERIGEIWLADIKQTSLDEKGEKYGIPPERRIKVEPGKMPEENILNKIQFAFIGTPATMHYETTAPLIAKGIPVFLSKPVDSDYQNARRLIELAETHGIPNVSGSQMLFHPAFVRAIEYIKENDVNVKRISINWVKERGPRDHAIPGITTEEGPHPYSIIALLMPELPYRVNAIDAEGEIIINPEDWKNYTDKTGTRCVGETKFKDKRYVLAEISTASIATLKYRKGRIATVYNDFENPRKARTVEIIGELPEGERFQRSVTIHVDLTDMQKKYVEPHKEHMPHIRKGIKIWQGCIDQSKKDRTGLGRLVLDESYEEADDFGAQFEAFLNWAETGKKPEYLATFADQFRSEKLIDAANKSIAKDEEVRYNGEEYV